MAFRYCLSRVRKRGHGLGNELIPWARAFIAAQVLQARLLPPAFGLNRRGYWRHFNTDLDDWIYRRAIERCLPVFEFTEADYLRHGGGDAPAALARFAAEHRLLERQAYVLVTEGDFGGFYHIDAARDFVFSTLYRSRYAPGNLLRLRQRIDPDKIVVGMHVRLGDFRAPQSLAEYRCAPNISLPLEWYQRVAASLQRSLGSNWQLLLVSDGSPEQLRPLTQSWPCITTADLAPGDCSDALALAGADLLVCSASSYSMLAAYLSDSPYLWFAPNLYPHPEGYYSLGDYDLQREHGFEAVKQALSQTLAHPEPRAARGVGIEIDGEVPASVIEAVQRRHGSRRRELDLVRYGVTPHGAVAADRQPQRA